MPTQRPFFANFWAAFRAHSSPTFNAKSAPGSAGAAVSSPVTSATAHVSTATATTQHPSMTQSNPRTISTKTGAFHQQPQTVRSPSPEAAVPITSSSLSRSPNTTSHYVGMAMSPPGTSTPLSRGRQRRGSDSSSSSGGFRDVLGTEKWYIGGITASGEEKFYRLGMVTSPGTTFGSSGKRVRSLDRLSL